MFGPCRAGASHLDTDRHDMPAGAPPSEFEDGGKGDVCGGGGLDFIGIKPMQFDAARFSRFGCRQFFGRAEAFEPCQPVQSVTKVTREEGRHRGGRVHRRFRIDRHAKADRAVLRQRLDRLPQREILRGGQPCVWRNMRCGWKSRLTQQRGGGQSEPLRRSPECLWYPAPVSRILAHPLIFRAALTSGS